MIMPKSDAETAAGCRAPAEVPMRRLELQVLLAVLLLAAVTTQSLAESRVALVIGNSAYAHAGALANPANDAGDVAAALERLGFKVITEKNVTKSAMDNAFRRFARAMRDADAALFFYAGHGMQFQGVNYLMPVDAKLEDEADLPYESSLRDGATRQRPGGHGPGEGRAHRRSGRLPGQSPGTHAQAPPGAHPQHRADSRPCQDQADGGSACLTSEHIHSCPKKLCKPDFTLIHTVRHCPLSSNHIPHMMWVKMWG